MRRLRILVVDDDTQLRLMWLRVLGRYHEVVLAEDGREALAVLSHHIDIVVSDLEMPNLDGRGLLRRVAELHPRIRRFLCSGSDPEVAREIVSQGLAQRYFTKPVDVAALLTAINAVAY